MTSRPELGTLALLDPQPDALLASAIENRVLLEPGAPIPRRLVVDGTGYIMENEVGRDMASNGMVYQFHHVRFGSDSEVTASPRHVRFPPASGHLSVPR